MNNKISKILEYFFLLLLFLTIGGVVYFNLSDIRYSLDYDAANTYYHYMEVIKNGTLRIPDWHHTTTLELDTSLFLAVIIWHITKNIFLSVGISNIIMILLYIFVIYRILSFANVKRTFIYATLCLVITPYAFGMLDYFNMMFFGVSYYSFKTLAPLLFLLLMQLLNKQSFGTKLEKAELVFAAFAYIVLLFVTTLSTGFYTLLCGIFPIILCMIIDIWTDGIKTNKYNKMHIALLAVTFIVFIIGYVLHNYYYPDVSRTNMRLTKVENYAINLRACVAGIFQLFGAITSLDLEAMSPWGIFYCLKIGLVVLFIIALIYNLAKILNKTEKFDIKKYLAFVFLFNFLLLVVADCRYSDNTHIEYRYYLIGAVPLILLFGIQLCEWLEKCNPLQQWTAKACILLALAAVLLGNHLNVIKNWDRSSYAVEFCDYFNTLDIDSVFFVDDEDTAVLCKGIDNKHKYGTFMTNTQTLVLSFCSYNQSASGSFYGNKNVLAVINGVNLYDILPAQIADNYQKIGSVRWLDIYYSDRVYFP